MRDISLTINGQRIVTKEGEKLLWAAMDNDIYIPNLCAIHDDEEPMAACRLCFVEIEGREQPVTACTETVVEGMVVNTRGEEALALARTGFELLLSSHPVDCAHCTKSGSCELQRIARYLGVKLRKKRFRELMRQLPVDDSHPAFIYDPNKCVLCGRCVWVCRRRLGIGVFGFAHRGFERMITTFGDEPFGASRCQQCDDCISVCPTGALVLKGGKGMEIRVGGGVDDEV